MPLPYCLLTTAFCLTDFVAKQFCMHVVHILWQFSKDLDNRLIRPPGSEAGHVLKNTATGKMPREPFGCPGEKELTPTQLSR